MACGTRSLLNATPLPTICLALVLSCAFSVIDAKFAARATSNVVQPNLEGRVSKQCQRVDEMESLLHSARETVHRLEKQLTDQRELCDHHNMDVTVATTHDDDDRGKSDGVDGSIAASPPAASSEMDGNSSDVNGENIITVISDDVGTTFEFDPFFNATERMRECDYIGGVDTDSLDARGSKTLGLFITSTGVVLIDSAVIRVLANLKSEHTVALIVASMAASLSESARHVIVDIGANVGWFTTVALRYGGPYSAAIAVDPQRSCTCIIEAHLECNLVDPTSRVTILTAAVGNPRVLESLQVPPNSGCDPEYQIHRDGQSRMPLASNFGTASTETISPGTSARVPVVTLVSLVTGPVAVVKIDTEGYELSVLGDEDDGDKAFAMFTRSSKKPTVTDDSMPYDWSLDSGLPWVRNLILEIWPWAWTDRTDQDMNDSSVLRILTQGVEKLKRIVELGGYELYLLPHAYNGMHANEPDWLRNKGVQQLLFKNGNATIMSDVRSLSSNELLPLVKFLFVDRRGCDLWFASMTWKETMLAGSMLIRLPVVDN